MAIVAKYNLDGIDIDWEYPGMIGDSNTYRPEDKQHYTILFRDLRQELDSLSKITRMKYYITTAVGGSQDYIDHTEMDKVSQMAAIVSQVIIRIYMFPQEMLANTLLTDQFRLSSMRACRPPRS